MTCVQTISCHEKPSCKITNSIFTWPTRYHLWGVELGWFGTCLLSEWLGDCKVWHAIKLVQKLLLSQSLLIEQCSAQSSVGNHNIVLHFYVYLCAICVKCVDLKEIIVTMLAFCSLRDFCSYTCNECVCITPPLCFILLLICMIPKGPFNLLLKYPILPLCFFGYNIDIACDVQI